MISNVTPDYIRGCEARIAAAFGLQEWDTAVTCEGTVCVISRVELYSFWSMIFPKGDFTFVLLQGHKQVFVGRDILIDDLPEAIQLMAHSLCRYGIKAEEVRKVLGITVEPSEHTRLRAQYETALRNPVSGRRLIQYQRGL